MSSAENQTLSKILFRRTRSQQVAFEVTATGIISGLVLSTTPQGPRGAIIFWAGVLLPTVSVFRWLAVTGRFSDARSFIGRTVRPVEFLGIISLVHVFQRGSQELAPYLNLSNTEGTAVVTLGATLLYLLIVEGIFSNYRLGWGAFYYLKRYSMENTYDFDLSNLDSVLEWIFSAESTLNSLARAFQLLIFSILRVTWGQTAFHLLKGAIPDKEDEYLDELRGFVEHNRRETPERAGALFAFTISAGVAIPLFIFVSWFLSFGLASLKELLLILIVMRLSKHLLGFTYIVFGTLEYDQFITSNGKTVALLFFYTAAVYWVFFRV